MGRKRLSIALPWFAQWKINTADEAVCRKACAEFKFMSLECPGAHAGDGFECFCANTIEWDGGNKLEVRADVETTRSKLSAASLQHISQNNTHKS